MSRISTLFVFVFFSFAAIPAFAQPSTPASNIVITPLAGNSAALRFTWTNGNGTNRVVIFKTAASAYAPVSLTAAPTSIASSLVSAFPVNGAGSDLDGTGETAACIFNSAVDGGGSAVSVTGLSPNVEYTIQVYEHNGSAGTTAYNYTAGALNPLGVRFFTTSTSWTATSVSSARIQAWGGGGGSGGVTGGSNRGCNGGGGGAYASSIVAVTPGSPYTVTVGGGGAGDNTGAAGDDGTASNFGSGMVIAAPGIGASANTAGGAGGTNAASTGTTENPGGTGGARVSGAGNGGGGGGGSAGLTGGGGTGGDASGATGGGAGAAGATGGAAGGAGGNNNAVGAVGVFPGGGGGGQGGTGGTTGSGAAGLVIVSFERPNVISATLNYGTGVLVVTFSQAVPSLASIDATRFHINNATGTDLVNLTEAEETSFSANTVTFTLTEAHRAAALAVSGTTGGSGGAVVLDVDAVAITNANINSNVIDDNNPVAETADTIVPTVAILSAPAGVNNTSAFSVTFEFSENVAGFVVGDISVGNGAAGNFVAVDGNTYTADITPSGAGNITINVNASVAQDIATNNNTAATQATVLFDNTPPTVDILNEPATRNTTAFSVTFEFSENVTGFVVGDILVGNGSAGNFVAVDGNTYTADITPSGAGNITINVNASVAQDVATNNNTAATTATVTFDNTAPTVDIQNEPASVNNTSAFNVTFEFSETVIGFVVGDISVGNGSAGNFVSVDGNTYTADITPNGSGNITINVSGSLAQDAATNNNTAATTATVTFDNTAPTVDIQNEPAGVNNTNAFNVTFEFSETVTGFVIGDISVGNGSVSNFVAVDGNTYTADITPDGVGNITINVNASVAQDAAANNNTAATTATVLFDNTPPAVDIQNEPATRNTTAFSVTFEFSENVTGFVVGDILVGNGSAGNFVAVDGNTYTADITPNSGGNITIDVNASVAQDVATNNNTAATTATVTFDNTAPTVDIQNEPAAVNNTSAFNVTFEFSETVTGFVVGDISVGNGSAGNFVAVDGNTYTADITPSGIGNITINVNASVAQDAATNNNTAATTATVTFDNTAPTVDIQNEPATHNITAFTVTFEFSETVTGFVVGDISVGNGSAGNFVAVDGNTYTADITPNGGGNITINVNASVVQDAAGNNNTAATTATVTFDNTPPTVDIQNEPATRNTAAFNVTFEFSENVTGFVVGGIVVGNGSAGNFVAVDGNTYTADITPNGGGNITIDVNASVAQDAATNVNNAATTATVVFDNTAPTVDIQNEPLSRNTTAFSVTFEFSENVTGFVVGDISVGNGSAGNFVAVDGNSYTADITPNGAGSITINVNASVAQDAATNNNTAAATATVVFDNTPPGVDIQNEPASVNNTSAFNVTFEFSENVTGFVVGDILVGNGSAGNFVTVDPNTYTADITPNGVGNITINVNASVAQDGATNNNTAATTATVTFDNTAPTVDIQNEPATRNTTAFNVTFEFSENVTGFVVGDISVGNGSAGNFVAVDGNTYTADITPNGGGNITINVNAAVAQDAAANDNTVATTATVTFDNTPPTVDIQNEPATRNTTAFSVTFEFSENVTGFVVGDISVGNGSAGSFVAIDGNTYTANITPSGAGNITINVNASVAQDAATNNNTAATTATVTFDNTGPTVDILNAPPSRNSTPFPVTFEFNENVIGFVVGDITVVNGSASGFAAVDGNTYTANITPNGVGDVTIDVNASVAQDGATNNNTAATQVVVVFDNIAPTLSPNEMNFNPNGGSPEIISFTFSEPLGLSDGQSVTGFTTSTGAIAAATYTLASNSITLNSVSHNDWTASTTVSYTAGNVNDIAGNVLGNITNHTIVLNIVNLSAGSIAFTSFSVDNLSWSFVALKDIPGGTRIKFTSNGWTGSTLRTDEETVTWEADGAGYSAGLEVKFTHTGSATPYTVNRGTIVAGSANEITVNSASSSTGDQFLAYQGTSTSPTFLTAITWYDNGWLYETGSGRGDNSSALPPLLNATNSLDANHNDNGAYLRSVTNGSVSAIRNAIHTVAWDYDDNPANVTFPAGSVTSYILPPDLTAVTPTHSSIVAATLPNLTLTFNDNVTAGISTGTGDIKLNLDNGTPVTSWNVGTAPVTFSGNTVTVNTSALSLTNNQVYEIDVAKWVFINADGNGNEAIVGDTQWKFTADASTPTVSSIQLLTPATSPTSATSVTFQVTFSENINGSTVSAGDFTVNASGVTIGTVSVVQQADLKVFHVTIPTVAITTPGVNGSIDLDVLAAATIADIAGNDFNTSFTGGAAYSIDQSNPTVTSIVRNTPSQQLTNATEVSFTVTFSENVSGIDLGDFVVSGGVTGTVTSVSVSSGTSVVVDVESITGNGTLRLDVDATTATLNDNAGSALSASFITGQSYTIDHTLPTVASILRLTPATSPTNASSVTFQVTFTEDINASTVSNLDFAVLTSGVTTGTVIVTPDADPKVFFVQINTIVITTPGVDGTVDLDVLASATINDLAGNDINASFTTGETYAIDQTAPVIQDIAHDPVFLNSWAAVLPYVITTPAYHANEFHFMMTFSEPVSNVSANKITPQIIPIGTLFANFVSVTPVDVSGNPATEPSRYWRTSYNYTSGAGAALQTYLNTNGPLVADAAGNLETTTVTPFQGGANYYSYITIPAPTNPVSNFITPGAPTSTEITLQWDHPSGAQPATHYLIRMKETSGPAFPPAFNVADGSLLADDTDPYDGVNDGFIIFNIANAGGANQSQTFTGLKSGVSYDFEIYPYTWADILNFTDDAIDYQTNTPATLTTSTNVASSAILTFNSAAASWSSTIVTQGSSANNLLFTIADETTDQDNAPFKFNEITIFENSGIDQIPDWREALAGAEFWDGTSNPAMVVTPTLSASGQILADKIIFTGIPTSAVAGSSLGYVADGTGISPTSPKAYRLRVWLKPSLEGSLPTNIDGLRFSYLVNNSSFSLDATNGQASTNFQGAQAVATGTGHNRVDVVASKLAFKTPGDPAVNPGINGEATNPPATIGVGSLFPTPPQIYALDANDNLDKGYNKPVNQAVAGSVTLGNSLPINQFNGHTTFTNGVLTLSNYYFTSPGTTTIRADDPSFTAVNDAVSSNVQAVISGLTQITDGPTAPAAELAEFSSLTTKLTGAVVPQLNATSVNFDFTITDDIGVTSANDDALPTRINTIIIRRDLTDDGIGDWTDAIEGAELSDDNMPAANTALVTVIDADYLSFSITSSTLGFIADGAQKTYHLKIWLKRPILNIADQIDNKDFVFNISQTEIFTDIGTTLGSPYSSTLQSSSTTSGDGNNIVRVLPTQVDFNPAPTGQWLTNAGQSYDAPLTPSPTAKVRDANGNLDTDYNIGATVVTATPATFPLANTTVTVTNGVITFDPNLQVTSAGGGTNNQITNLVLSSGGLTIGTSNPFTLFYSGNSNIVRNTGFSHNTNILYATANNQVSDITNSTGTEVEEFIMQDGGNALSDSDGSKTRLASITLNISNHQYIRSVALFDGSTQIAELDASNFDVVTPGNITFSSLAPFEADDNDDNILTVKVSFNQFNILDNAVINVRLVSATTAGVSSSFAIGGTSTTFPVLAPTENMIQVQASQLDFTGISNYLTANSLTYYTAAINSPLPSPVGPIFVEARDANKNRDVNFNGAIVNYTIANGLTTLNGPSGSFLNGTFTFNSGFQYTSGNNQDGDITLNAGISGTSPNIKVISSFESRIYSFTTAQNISYINYQESTDLDWITLGNAAPIQGFRLSDGDVDGTPNDNDGADTELTSLTLGISNPQSIERIALYYFNTTTSTWVEAADQPGSNIVITSGYGQINFSGLSIKAPDDGSTDIYAMVSFDNSATNITDNSIVEISILAAVSGGGSKFRGDTGDLTAGTFIGGVTVSTPANAPVGTNAGAVGAENTIEVLATQLDFTTQPGVFAGINEPITEPTVSARDTNGAVDKDQHAGGAATTPGAITTGGPGISFASRPFAQGVMNFPSFQYTSAGNGTLTVQTVNDNGSLIQGTSNHVDVIHVTTALATGGVFNQLSLAGGATNKVIFGVTFKAPYTVTGEPKLEKFTISFSTLGSIIGIFNNIQVYESANNFFEPGLDTDITVSAIGGKLAQANKSVTIDFTQSGGIPRDLSTAIGNELTYFLEVDIDQSANANTPLIQPRVEDAGFGSSTNLNIVTSEGSSVSSIVGTNYNFAAVNAPTIISSFPAKGQLNVDPTQATLDLVFSVPVWTLDGKIKLYDYNTDQLVQELTAINGLYLGGTGTVAGTVANPLKFTLPALLSDHLYYIVLPAGKFNGESATNNVGIMDESKIVSPGFSYSGVLYFKTVSPNPPSLLTTPAAPKAPSITNVSLTGATINGIFDKPGKAYFMVLGAGSPAPTNDQINGNAVYSSATIIDQGSFAIDQTSTITQFGLINAQLSTSSGYDVWMYAESYASKKTGGIETLTPIPTGNAYGNAASGFRVVGTGSPVAVGPTLTFNTPASAPAGITVFKPNVQVCTNSFQTMNSPIVIVESAPGDFNTAGVEHNFNLLLPSGFSFDDSKTAGVPNHGTVILNGLDFVAGSGKLSYINNSILRVSFKNDNANGTLDNITITGLRIFATTSTIGSLTRLGGNALSTLPDNTSFAELSSYDAATIEFTNSYSENEYSTRPAPITIIPDNYDDPNLTEPLMVRLIPKPLAGDFGANAFSGTGVSANLLNLSAATLGTAFNITVTHTDNNGCISESPVQYTVYDHENAIKGLAIEYCAENTNFPGSAPFNSIANVKNISYLADPATYLLSMTATIPAGNHIIKKGTAWDGIIAALPVAGPANPAAPTDPDLIAFHNYTFDVASILNAGSIPGLTDPYSSFMDVTNIQRNVFYKGGSLGIVEFTAEYRGRINTQLEFPLKQNVTFFVPAIPIVEVDQSNQSGLDTNDPFNPLPPANLPNTDPRNSNKGTPVFCSQGGIININGFPRADGSSTIGTFRLEDAETDVILTPSPAGFSANNNGTASINPAVFSNSNRSIRIVYTYKDNNSPCESSGSQVIRIEPNPVASFTNSAYTCAGTQINFTNTSTPVTGPFSIASHSWAFNDQNASDAENKSDLINPVHTFIDPGTYNVSLTASSGFNCKSTVFNKIMTIGSVPVVDFDFAGVSTGEPITFKSESAVGLPNIDAINHPDNIVTLDWDFGDLSPLDRSLDNDTIIYHKYNDPGIYQAILKIRSTVGCINSFATRVVVVPKLISSEASTNIIDFNGNNGGWQVVKESATPDLTWKWGVPNGFTITGQSRSWTTASVDGQPAVPYKNENSALYTADYDISALERPMISFNSFVQMAQSDGVVLEYSIDSLNIADPDKDWITLGAIDQTTDLATGVDWFNGRNLASKPGKQENNYFGWTQTLDSDNDGVQEWLESKHSLGDVPRNKKRLVFRFAFASVSDPQTDGFAIDNFRIGNRTRIVLLENFRNLGNGTQITRNNQVTTIEKAETDSVNSFNPAGTASSVVRINYHVAFPNLDPLNKDNAQDPGARALYYNISETPRVRMDGEATTSSASPLFSAWGRNLYNIRSLKLADAEITTLADKDPDGNIRVAVTIKALRDLGPETILNVAIVEKTIGFSGLLTNMRDLVKTGENQAEYVLKKLLPSAAGTRFNQVLPFDQTRNFQPFIWTKNVPLYDPTDDLAVIIFLQNEDTREIYQTEIVDLVDPGTVTGIEDLNTSFKVYPNPADREVLVELPTTATKRTALKMFDQMGKTVEQSFFEKGETTKTITTESLSGGVYLIQIQTEKGVLRRKMMVTHRN